MAPRAVAMAVFDAVRDRYDVLARWLGLSDPDEVGTYHAPLTRRLDPDRDFAHVLDRRLAHFERILGGVAIAFVLIVVVAQVRLWQMNHPAPVGTYYVERETQQSTR